MIPIYRTDPYLFSLETIADAVTDDGETQLVTGRELIFAEGGGQPRDYGSVTFEGQTEQVLELVKGKGDVRLRIKPIPGLTKGKTIQTKLDSQRRLSIMRLHTTQHALAGALRRVLPDYQTGGMQISEDATECSMRFISNGFGGEEDLKNGIDVVQQAIKDGLKVEAKVFDNLDLAVKEFGDLYRPSDPRVQIKGKVRIVHIDGLDANACGGTHLRNLSEAETAIVRLKEYNSESGEGIVLIS